MSVTRARTFLTVLIAFAITLPLPFAAYFGFKLIMTKVVTRDNAGIVFDQFQETIDQGLVVIHDSFTAANVADQAYRLKMHGPAVDGWADPFRITAVVKGDSCQLTVVSAGPDGAFGTADDIRMERTFDLSKPRAKSP
jgi:predicted P-loop ATPase/GTPase